LQTKSNPNYAHESTCLIDIWTYYLLILRWKNCIDGVFSKHWNYRSPWLFFCYLICSLIIRNHHVRAFSWGSSRVSFPIVSYFFNYLFCITPCSFFIYSLTGGYVKSHFAENRLIFHYFHSLVGMLKSKSQKLRN
jgi:hypothetical protein